MVFPALPVLETMRMRVDGNVAAALQRTVFVCSQHLLRSTGSLFECLVRCGAEPRNIFLMGKVYSTHEETAKGLRALGAYTLAARAPTRRGYHDLVAVEEARTLWGVAMDRLATIEAPFVCVLDDGANCARSIPPEVCDKYRVFGIEQTTSGTSWFDIHSSPFPVVQVATTAVKRHIEPVLIADAVIAKCMAFLSSRAQQGPVGVVGLGNIGKALALALNRLGHDVLGFDQHGRHADSGAVRPARSGIDVVKACSVVFGCTGRDWFQLPVQCIPPGEKTLISCSTSDVEYRALLDDLSAILRGDDETCCPTLVAADERSDLHIRFPRSGFPINFDNGPESVPDERIQLTRGLLFGAILQVLDLSAETRETVPLRVMLDPLIQRFVVNAWGESAQLLGSEVLNYGDPDWIAKESAGARVRCEWAIQSLSAGA